MCAINYVICDDKWAQCSRFACPKVKADRHCHWLWLLFKKNYVINVCQIYFWMLISQTWHQNDYQHGTLNGTSMVGRFSS